MIIFIFALFCFPTIINCHCFCFNFGFCPSFGRLPKDAPILFLRIDHKLPCGLLVLPCQRVDINTEARSSDLPWVRRLGRGKARRHSSPRYHSHQSVVCCGGRAATGSRGCFEIRVIWGAFNQGMICKGVARMGKETTREIRTRVLDFPQAIEVDQRVLTRDSGTAFLGLLFRLQDGTKASNRFP